MVVEDVVGIFAGATRPPAAGMLPHHISMPTHEEV